MVVAIRVARTGKSLDSDLRQDPSKSRRGSEGIEANVLFQSRERPVAIRACLLEAVESAVVISQGCVNLRDRNHGPVLSLLESSNATRGAIGVALNGIQIGEFREQAGLRGIVQQDRAAVAAPGLAVFTQGGERSPHGAMEQPTIHVQLQSLAAHSLRP